MPSRTTGKVRVLCAQPDADTLAFSGELTFATAARALDEGSRALGDRSRLDLAGVDHADSAGLATVLALQAQASRAGRRLAIVNAPEGMLALAEVCDARTLLEPAMASARVDGP
ncbi:MAG: STAS domain-containing protein [Proteobacteria bacterium]|nr:STAS domain-containing protein [Pseudomonadota bacterium]